MLLSDITPLAEIEPAGELSDAATLRARLDQDGFLLLRSVVDRDAVIALRDQVVGLLADHGIAERDSDPPRWTGHRPAPEAMGAAQRTLLAEASWRELMAHPDVTRIAETLIGEPLFWGGSVALRCSLPAESGDAPLYLHQDANALHGAPFQTLWIPLVDIGRELGGLAVLPGSHREGLRYHDPSLLIAAGEVASGRTWFTADYDIGDVVVFTPLLVHTGLPNRTQDGIRLSFDARAQAASAPRPEYFSWSEQIAPYVRRAYEIALASGLERGDAQRAAFALRDDVTDLDDDEAVERVIRSVKSG